MNGINVFFHLGSLALALTLVGLWLRALRQRDLLRGLIQAARQGGQSARRRAGTPVDVISQLAGAIGIAIDVAQPGVAAKAPTAMDLAPWAELFVATPVLLVRWDGDLVVVQVGPGGAQPPPAEVLTAALGGRVAVLIQQ